MQRHSVSYIKTTIQEVSPYISALPTRFQRMLSMSQPRKLFRSVTCHPWMSTATCPRRRLLSEQNGDDATIASDDGHQAKKRCKRDSLGHESTFDSHQCVATLCFFETTKHLCASPVVRRRSVIYDPGDDSQSLPSESPPRTVSTAMLICQQQSPLATNTENVHEEKRNQSIFLTSAQASAYLTSDKGAADTQRISIIDCGLSFRYNDRRIKHSFLLNVNDKLSRKRLVTRGLKNFLDDEQFNRLNASEMIILYDDTIHPTATSCSASASQFELSPSMKSIVEQIQRVDTTKVVCILQTPFEEFFQQYPTLCESYSAPKSEFDQALPPPTPDVYSFNMSEIVPGLFLGNANDAENMSLLQQNQIKSIINISQTIPCYHETERLFDYLRVPCNDSSQENIVQHFQRTSESIQMSLSLNQNVLVHCQAGVSRSPSFVIGYLMEHHSKTFDQAYSLVREKRTIINPNFNFLAQLTRYEQMLNTRTSAQ